MSWTDERVETLKRMWAEGQSASQIAKELGGVTRNAVIGKVHRLGLSNRAGGVATPAPAKPVPTREKPTRTDAPEPRVEAAPTPEKKPVEPRPAAAAAPQPVPPSPAPTPAVPAPRKPVLVTAGQPLPPQPSANEISPETLASVREVEKTARKLTLMELTERTCKWPIGDPATPDFWFCGLPVQQGKPYCEAHVTVAFQPMSARRDRKR
ncbi:GcrA family cell cycle regulator [Rhodovulum strictum]|uniref:GcrA cell cycle regulator n=1 Tax=Rhodovulum strictum TaxID=58314 RepID=A0A844B7W2_9RHOB|nr:GcrA family cell cycle regulator [Rhodovulum strictum]MRH22466.1 GcrA cell cycle regulator [Rhodovulum strictum]